MIQIAVAAQAQKMTKTQQLSLLSTGIMLVLAVLRRGFAWLLFKEDRRSLAASKMTAAQAGIADDQDIELAEVVVSLQRMRVSSSVPPRPSRARPRSGSACSRRLRR